MTEKPQLYRGQSLVLVERSRAVLAEWEVKRLTEALRWYGYECSDRNWVEEDGGNRARAALGEG